MTLNVEIVDPMVDPEPAGWSTFCRRAGLYQTWAYDLLQTESWMSRNPPLVVVARHDHEPVAAMSVMVGGVTNAQRYATSRPPRRIAPALRLAQVCQPWLATPGFTVGDDVAQQDRRPLVRAMERELRRHLGWGLVGLVYRSVPADLVSLVAGRGRSVRAVSPTAVLHNSWTTEAQWLAALTRKRRKYVRWVDRLITGDDTIVTAAGHGRTDVDGAELAAMLRDHRARHARAAFDPRSPVSGAYLQALLGRPDVHTLTYHDLDGRVIAFLTTLDHPVTPFLQFWAVRTRDDGGRPHLYFDAQARAVRRVISDGTPALASGRGMFEEKRSLGFDGIPMSVVTVPALALGR